MALKGTNNADLENAAGGGNVPLGIYQDPGDTYGLYITSPGFQTYFGAYLQNVSTTKAGLMASPDYIKLLGLSYAPTNNVTNVNITSNFSGLVIDANANPPRFVIRSNAIVYDRIGLQFNNGFDGAEFEIYWQANFTNVEYSIQEVIGGKPSVIVGDYQKFTYKDGKWWDSVFLANTNLRSTATLVGGTVTVLSSRISISDRILLTRNTPNGTVGFLSAPSGGITAQTSFIINSTSATDTSTINWQIVK